MDLSYYRVNEYSDVVVAPGDTVYMSDLVSAGEDDAEFVQVPYTVWGDYVGSLVERSNSAVLWSQFYEILVKAEGGWGSEFLLLPLIPVAEENEEAYELLGEIVEKLENYPLVDEDAYSELEWELIEGAIGDYLIADLRREFPGHEDEVLKGKVYEYLQESNESPYCEDAVGSVVFPKIEEWMQEHLPAIATA